MICPDALTSEVSALQAVRVRDHAKHDLLHAGRDGAGNESTGSDIASFSQEDHLVASGRDYRHQRLSLSFGPHCLGRYRADGTPQTSQTGASTWSSGRETAPLPLQPHPQNQCHRDQDSTLTQPDTSLATKSGHFDLPTTSRAPGPDQARSQPPQLRQI